MNIITFGKKKKNYNLLHVSVFESDLKLNMLKTKKRKCSIISEWTRSQWAV